MRSIRRLVVICAATLGIVALWVGVAEAHEVHQKVGEFTPVVSSPTGVAVNQSTGNVYVASEGNGEVYEYDETGTPLNGGLALVTGVGGALGIAVDNASDPESAGDLYVPDRAHNAVDKYSSTGTLICELNVEGGALPCPGAAGHTTTAFTEPEDVAVDPSSGDVYVSDTHSANNAVDVFSPSGAYIANITGEEPLALNHPHYLSVDSHSNLYVATTNSQFQANGVEYGVVKFTPNALPVTEGTIWSESVTDEQAGAFTTAVAVDSSDNVLVGDYLGFEGYGPLFEYSSSGSLIGKFAEGSEERDEIGYGLAVNNTTGNIYYSNREHDSVFIYNSFNAPTVTTGAASEVGLTSAKVAGTVNPEGLTIENCYFEYEETGATPGSGEKVPCESAGGESFSGKLEGLSPGTAYKYNLFVETEGHVTAGSAAEFTTKLAPPVVTNKPVLSVTRTTVSLSGEINPGNRETHYYIEFGENEAHGANGSPTNPVTLEGADVSPHKIAPQTLEELHAGTTYHYRIVATSEGGTTLGPESTFTTGPKQPASVEAESGQATSQTTATLTATVNPNGLPANYSLEVATELNAGVPVYIPQSFGQVGESAETLTLTLTNLLPGTTYYWRVVVHNPEGSVMGADAVFATPSFANPITEPLHPLLVPVPPEEKPGPVTVETRAQKLAKALHKCTRQPKKKRAACRRKAEKQYGPIKKRK